MYSVRRRRGLLGVAFVLLLGVAAFAASGRLFNEHSNVLSTSGRLNATGSLSDPNGTGTASVTWPLRGQAALLLGNGRPAVSPHEQPVPIASVAKVMTAYLTLERYPLTGAQDGFTVTVTAAQAQAEAQDAREDQSVAPVQAGEHLTERQLLEALLIPSGNNIARMLAARVAGSETRFVAQMNAETHALRMGNTTYTDPSGWDPSTVSTAADQLRIFRQAMRFPVFRQIVSLADVTLPFGGTLTNTNPLITEGYAGKTGSDSAAGACLAFFTHVTVRGRRQTAVGVVLGQWESNSTSVDLAAAGQAAEQLVDSVAPASEGPSIAISGTVGRRGRHAGSLDGVPRLPPRTGGRDRGLVRP